MYTDTHREQLIKGGVTTVRTEKRLKCLLLTCALILIAVPYTVAADNVVHIPDPVSAAKGEDVTVPIMIYGATGVGCVELKLSYNASVVIVTDAEQGDFTSWFVCNSNNAANGWVTINTYKQKPESEPITWPGLIGDVKVADVTLEAVGNPGDSSPLNLEILTMTEADAITDVQPRSTDNGSFIISGTAPEPVDPAPVPAFTTFGMLVVTGLLCAIGVTAVRKKRKI